MRFLITTLFALFIISASVSAQKKIKLEKAGNLTGKRKDGVNYTILTDNVKFSHKGTIFYCDSAVLVKKTNYLDAYGHVKIIDGDSITVTANTLHYDGNTKIAKLRNNVVLTKLDQMQLFTDFLDYDRSTNIATYFNHGKVVDSTNVLTSEKGYFNTNSSFSSFKTNVVGTNKEKTLQSDTLVYNTKTGIVYFVAPTIITDVDGNIFNYTEGIYETKRKSSNLYKGIAETESYYMKGNKMMLDDIRKEYTAIGNVYMLSKNQDIIITGQKAIMNKATKTTKIFDKPLLKMIDKTDTLYMTADTLVSIDSDDNASKRLLAYSNVKIFKKELRGVADSIAYFVADSIMTLFGDPVLWSGENQMSGDTIDIFLENNSLHKMELYPKAFVASSDSAEYFNQIKGRSMVAWFKEEELSLVNVYGNGESIFFMRDEKTLALVGMNNIICSDITLRFKDRKLIDASFLVKPEGKFIPPQELKSDDIKLNGFKWRGEEKPEKSDLLDNDIDQKTKIEYQDTIKEIPANIKKRPAFLREKRPSIKEFNQK
ncbi:MAG: Organic solvent tolerance protein OstA [Cyclobacteriaceae bacterium]|nr:Organic solvent tolerance protein OstA [Cyclobacteriaceae bacterium]